AALLKNGETVPHAEAAELANNAGEFCGQKWRAPQIEELFPICDRSKFDPALDPAFWQFLIDGYKSDQDGNWRIWSATKYAESPESLAWNLFLNYGYALVYHQYGVGFALAVCGPVPSAGQ